MSTLGTLTNIAGMPGADAAVTAALNLVKSLEDVKIYKFQCKELGLRCMKLSNACRERVKGLEGTEIAAELDEIDAVIDRAYRKASEWAQLGKVMSFVHQSEIKLGLESLYKDLENCAQRFNLAATAELHLGQREMRAAAERDAAENREILRTILSNVDKLKEIRSDPMTQGIIMDTLQNELQRQASIGPEANSDTYKDLQQGLNKLQTVDLTGQITNVTKSPVTEGGFNVVFKGIWLGEEEVALKFARTFNQTESTRRRFQREVEIWRKLQHRNVCRLYGIVYIDEQIYSVSPWMLHGDAFKYIKSTEEVIDRLAIIRDVASGTEYLHTCGIVHGDLRAANVLIGDDRRAVVSDFGLSKVIEETMMNEHTCDTSSSTTTHGETPVRWQAPELVDPEDNVEHAPVTFASDVWSFGMLCLEILSGKRPYHYLPRDGQVVGALMRRRLPDRPRDEEAITRGLDDQMWTLMLHCWCWVPEQRPIMADVRANLKKLTERQRSMTSPSAVLEEQTKIFASPKSQPINLPSTSSQTNGAKSPTLMVPASKFTGAPLVLSSTPPRDIDLLSTPPKSSDKVLSLGTPPIVFSSGGNSPLRSTSPYAPAFPRQPLESKPSHPRYASSSSSLLSSTINTNTLAWNGAPTTTAVISRRPIGRMDSASSTGHDRQYSGESLFDGGWSSPRQSPLSAASGGLSLTRPGREQTHNNRSFHPHLQVSEHDGDEAVGELIDLRTDPSDVISNGLELLNVDPRTHTPNTPFTPIPSPTPSLIEAANGSSVSLSSSVPSQVDHPFNRERNRSMSFSVIQPKNELLDFSTLDLTESIAFSKNDGAVKYASLNSLVDQLLMSQARNEETPREREFREAFLTTHRLFTTSNVVLRHLLFRILKVDSSRVEERVDVRFKIFSILKQWLRGHYAVALDDNTLENLRSFLQEITSPETFVRASRDLISTISHLLHARTIATSHRVRSDSMSSSSTPSTSDMTPSDIALAMFIYEDERYKLITPTDYVSHLLYKRDHSFIEEDNRVKEASMANNKIMKWVKESVLRQKKTEARKDVLSFFTRTAFECRRRNNFASLSAIYSAIESPELSGLVLTKKVLDEKEFKDSLRTIAKLLDAKNSYAAYKAALPKLDMKPRSGTNDPQNHCVPLLAVHLRDTTSIYEKSPTFHNEKKTIICFHKFMRVYQSITTALAYQHSDNEAVKRMFETLRTRCAKPIAYLEDKLGHVHLGVRDDDRLAQRGKEVAEEEKYNHYYRVDELEATGFRTTRKR